MKPQITITDKISLRLLEESDADALFELTDANREYLREWLPWLDLTKSSADTLDFIRRTISQRENGQGPTYGIVYEQELCGVIGFHPIDNANHIAEIGYWLSADKQKHGIVTKCCRELIKMAFAELGVNRIQIPAGEHNRKSRAIPERLGMTFEGIIRDREYLYGKYLNHAMYSLLKREYREENS